MELDGFEVPCFGRNARERGEDDNFAMATKHEETT